MSEVPAKKGNLGLSMLLNWPDDFVNKVICGDCLEVMKGMPDQCVDLVLTDPPYGINGGRGGGSKARGRGNYSGIFQDTREYIRDMVIGALKDCFRISRATIITPGSKNLDLYPQYDSFGCFYQPAAMGFQRWGMMDAQPILFYGEYYLQGIKPMPCSFILTEKPSCTEHPCSKPINAWIKLLERSCPKESIIFDPFLGSGTTAVAAIQTGRRFIGIEIDPGYCEIARRRIAQAQEQQDLFRKPAEDKQGELLLL